MSGKLVGVKLALDKSFLLLMQPGRETVRATPNGYSNPSLWNKIQVVTFQPYNLTNDCFSSRIGIIYLKATP